jgi:hypothetical protein
MEERPSIPQPDTSSKTESADSRGTSPSGFSLLTFLLSTITSLHSMIASFDFRWLMGVGTGVKSICKRKQAY